jgi:hypothetical protein
LARLRFSLGLLLAAAALSAVAVGCGSGSEGGGESSAAPARPSPGDIAEREAPKGASPTLRAVYREFPPPKPDPAVSGSGAAIKAGERACRGKTPIEVKRAFYAKAISSGLQANSDEAKMVRQIRAFEKATHAAPSFPAGQLAADVYQATLPAKMAQYGYQGCVHALATGFKREVEKEQKKR